ncbi:MAG: hypothetical protein D6738_03620 [Acidobacteria bacterium]|nr:MAG: hypothetical protein D6738_03620 [Acidobacteriota bacterium]
MPRGMSARGHTATEPDATRSDGLDELLPRLERVLRDELTARLGGGPRIGRIAHLRARAEVLAALARVAGRHAQPGDRALEGAPARQRDLLARNGHALEEESRQLGRRALELEAEHLCGEHGPRYVELLGEVEQVARAGDEAALRALVNDLEQARQKLGQRAVSLLAERLADGLGDVPADLARRLAALRAEEVGDDARTAPDEELPRLRRLAREADELAARAPEIEREELFHRIQLLGAQLKEMQESGRPAGREADRLLRGAFGALTRTSKKHQPGWTPVLDSRRVGLDWRKLATTSRRWLQEREARRRELRRQAEREQRLDAIRRLREDQRRQAFEDAVEKLRLAAYRLSRWSADPEITGDEDKRLELEREARRQATLAARLAGGEDDLRRVAAALEGHEDVVRAGRGLAGLRRLLGIEEPAERPPAGSEDEAAERFDQELADDVGEALVEEWPPEILDVEGAGAGERVLIVGGLPDRQRRELLQRFFGWADAEWVESYRDRQADFKTLRQRIADGRFDRVIILARFCGHDVSGTLVPACRRYGVAFHVNPRGVSIPVIARIVYGA